MHYLCSSSLRINPKPVEQIPSLTRLLQLTPEQQSSLRNVEPVEREGHVSASNCYTAWFTALGRLREEGKLVLDLGDGFEIVDVSTRFGRYENALYLYFKVRSAGTPQTEPQLIKERDELHKRMLERFGQDLNFDFHVTSKVAEYRELLRLQPVTPLYQAGQDIPEQIQSAYGQEVQGKGYHRFHRLSYANEHGKEYTADGTHQFVREQASIIKLDAEAGVAISDSTAARCHLYEMVHTELVFFHRTQAMESRLAPTYRRIEFLKELVHTLEDHWVRIRSFFSVAPKFALTKRSRSANLFFNLLEVNGQLRALKNSISSRMEREHSQMQERYERLHFNVIGKGTESEQEYLQLVHQEVERSFRAYSQHLDKLRSSLGRLAESIEQLRGDFDSNTNIILQLLVLTLSIVLVFWGVVALGLDKGIHVASQQTLDAFSMVGLGVLALFGVLGLYGLVATLFMAGATRVMKKSGDRVVHTSLEYDGELNQELEARVAAHVERHLTHLRKLSAREKKQRYNQVFAINHLLEVIIMILPAVSLRHLGVHKARAFIKQTRQILGMRQ